MKKPLLFLQIILFSQTILADSFQRNGIDSVGSDFFGKWYHQPNLVHWLENKADFAVYLTETTGNWQLPDQLVFSIEGNPHRQNHYYLNGFRTDSRFHAGSTMYIPNMEHHSLLTDTYQSRLYFQQDSLQSNYVRINGNAGGLGGVSPTTIYLISLNHNSARERFYYETDLSHPHNGKSTGLFPEDYRQHILGAGQIEAQYSVPTKGNRYLTQHVYADFGWRTMPEYRASGIEGSYVKPWYKVQANGELPMPNKTDMPTLNYLLNISSRGTMGQEFLYNRDEIMQNDTWSASLYLQSPKHASTKWTAGLTWATNRTLHDNLEFERNIVDQDGEAFEPWMTDGYVHELTAAATVSHRFNRWLTIDLDGANSVLFFSPTTRQWSNKVVWQSMFGNESYDLYTINWQAEEFTAGLLENTVSLKAEHSPVKWFTVKGAVDFTLDGVLLSDNKSFLRPNWQANISLHFQPCEWFTADLNIGDYRMTFDIEHVRFFSDKYMNGNMMQGNTLFGTTGGKYHRLNVEQWQPRYFLIALPFRFDIGRHEISVISSFRKYHDMWDITLDGGADKYGYFIAATPSSGYDGQVFFFNPAARYYTTQSASAMGNNIFNNTPFYASNLIKYAYNGKKWYVSFSWQSFIMTSTSAFGNGPLANDVNILSETLANPNSRIVSENKIDLAHVGRANQDRAYIARFLLAYNINKNWQLGMTFKFEDGQPFSNYSYMFAQDGAGNTQVAVWNRRSRGINPTNGNFGSRKDAFFNLDINASYKAYFKNNSCLSVCLFGYNLYDFGTELTEFTFEENGDNHRYAMSLCIPRGLMVQVKYEF